MKTSQLSKFKQEVLKVLDDQEYSLRFTMDICEQLVESGALPDNGKQEAITREALQELQAAGFVKDTGEHSIWSTWKVIPVVPGFLTLPLDDGFIRIQDVRPIDTDGDYLAMAGTVRIFGVLYHVRFSLVQEVTEPSSERGSLQEFFLAQELCQISALGEPFHTFELPGYEGEWVMTMFPECA